MNILVIKFRNLGDVLLTGPLVSTLKRHWPGARVTVLVRPGTEAMMAGHPHLDEVLAYPARLPGEGRLRYLRRQLQWVRALRRRRFDLVLNTTEGDRGALMSRLSGAPRRIGPAPAKGDKRWRRWMYTERVPARAGRRHTVIRHLDLLRFQPVHEYRRVHLAFDAADLAAVRALLGAAGRREELPLVQVHPTSRWFFKCWEDAAMAQAIDHLQQACGVQVVVTSGPDRREQDKVRAIVARCATRPLDLSGRLSLKQTAALSSLCRLFFGVDTATMHMAAALDVPVVALFGPSGGFEWGPWPNDWAGEGSPYGARSGLQSCGPHAVIQKDWDCVPCGRDGCQGSKRSACLEQTTVAEVIPVLERALRLDRTARSAVPQHERIG